ncbi:MAG TPA: hypothetical protein VFU26_12920 [Gaiellaceae bacterium]|nr:hypothetical protein [Gaiellaceae bacterium]
MPRTTFRGSFAAPGLRKHVVRGANFAGVDTRQAGAAFGVLVALTPIQRTDLLQPSEEAAPLADTA